LHGAIQNSDTGYEYYLRAAVLGSNDAYRALGDIWRQAEPPNPFITELFYKHAAIRGNVRARYFLAVKELERGNLDRCANHLLIACRGGSTRAMVFLRLLHQQGRPVPQRLIDEADQHHHAFLELVHSEQRDAADAFRREHFHLDEPYDN
jgi:TPR repeat protein